MSQLGLVAPPEHRKGDALGRSYTPEHVAQAIVGRVFSRGWDLGTVWEPCVGGGSFLRAARAFGARWLIGTDLDGQAPGRDLCDEFRVQPAEATYERVNLAITNPPFGRAVGQATTLGIARATIAAGRTAVLLVPVDYLTQNGWYELVDTCAQVWPIIGRVWEHERGMVVLVWRRGCEEPTLFDPLVVR